MRFLLTFSCCFLTFAAEISVAQEILDLSGSQEGYSETSIDSKPSEEVRDGDDSSTQSIDLTVVPGYAERYDLLEQLVGFEYSDKIVAEYSEKTSQLCTREQLDGMIKICCQNPANPGIRNCTNFTFDLATLCKQKKLECKAVYINCLAIGFAHAIGIVNMGPPDGWTLVDAMTGKTEPLGPDADPNNIPPNKLCKVLGKADGCGCTSYTTDEPTTPNTESTYCKVLKPRLNDCVTCCKARQAQCYKEAKTPQEQRECDGFKDRCEKECKTLPNQILPDACANEASRQDPKQTRPQCDSCCLAHPMFMFLLSGGQNDAALQWKKSCEASCANASLQPGEATNVCSTVQRTTQPQCSQCCWQKGNPPHCKPSPSPACLGWTVQCLNSCKTVR